MMKCMEQEIKKGDKIRVMGELETEVEKIQDGLVYFFDENNRLWNEVLEAIEVIQSNYMHVEPDSHFWTDIKMLMNFIAHQRMPGYAKNYLLTGLKNTLDRGYDIQPLNPKP